MIRGVNKHIIEVINTEDEVFEKAILFVKPDLTDIGNAKIMKEADRYVNKIKRHNIKLTNRKALAIKAAKVAGFMASGGVIAALILR